MASACVFVQTRQGWERKMPQTYFRRPFPLLSISLPFPEIQL